MTTENNNLENKLRIRTDENTTDSIQPKQNELDLEFDKIDPVIPKKTLAQEPSMLDKAKGFVHSFGKKTEEVPQSQSQESVSPIYAEPKADSHSTENNSESPETETSITENLKKPEKWSMLQILPAKYRRLFIVLLIGVIILLLISWLKPKSETVQSFEDKTSRDIPTQFQSLDSEQPMEPTVLETLNSQNNDSAQEQETVTGSTDDKAQAVTNTETVNTTNENTVTETNVVNDAVQQSTTEQVTSNQSTAESQQSVQQNDNQSNVAPTVAPVKKAVQEEPTKEKETKVAKTEKHKSVPSRKQQQEMQKLVNKLAKDNSHSSKATTTPIKSANISSVSNKTLTIEKGKSLMQIFRENNLNISDVNAMTKAKGANNALSSFNAGDKVQVSLNSEGRVAELKLKNGSRFIRQANGNYQFKK